MSFRDFIEKLEKEGKLVKIDKPVSKRLEASGLLNAMEEKVVLLSKINESDFRVVGNIFATKDLIASYFSISPQELIPKMINAIDNPSKPEVVSEAQCQEIDLGDDIDKLPILFHCEGDGGNYISSGVVISKHPEHGQNLDFHRCMQIGKNKMSVRIVKKRDFDIYLQEQKEMPVAICVGNSPNVLLGAAIRVGLDVDELDIANTLEPLKLVKAKTSDLLVPADCEFVIEGTVSLNEMADEGPFVDLTETVDVVRQEPVLTVKKITCRKDAIWQALLPGGLEHKILMGMPREPTIFRKVNEVVKCLDVSVNPGGCSWLHAIIKIDKQNMDDGKKALAAAFEGHSSLKHAFVVDKDVNILDPLEVEWAMATRFQGDKDIFVKGKESGSSLDPSAEPGTKMTYKMGFDLTKPLVVEKGKNFEKAEFPKINPKDFLE